MLICLGKCKEVYTVQCQETLEHANTAMATLGTAPHSAAQVRWVFIVLLSGARLT